MYNYNFLNISLSFSFSLQSKEKETEAEESELTLKVSMADVPTDQGDTDTVGDPFDEEEKIESSTSEMEKDQSMPQPANSKSTVKQGERSVPKSQNVEETDV